MPNNFYGRDGFYWWQGVVENRMDPLFLGRCKVRIMGVHTDTKTGTSIPTNDLPWALPVIPLTSETKIIPPKEGTWVFGFYRDGDECQDPIILGTMPGVIEEGTKNLGKPPTAQNGFFDPVGIKAANDLLPTRPLNIEKGFVLNPIDNSSTSLRDVEYEEDLRPKNIYPKHGQEPDTHRLARDEAEFDPRKDQQLLWKIQNAIKKVRTSIVEYIWREPDPISVYNALYPFNKVEESESGHLKEVDDTEYFERLHNFHRSGTYDEVQANGTKMHKTVGDSLFINHLDRKEYTINSERKTVGGSSYSLVMEDQNQICEGSNYYAIWSYPTIYTSSLMGDINIKCDGPGTINQDATMIFLNCGVSVDPPPPNRKPREGKFTNPIPPHEHPHGIPTGQNSPGVTTTPPSTPLAVASAKQAASNAITSANSAIDQAKQSISTANQTVASAMASANAAKSSVSDTLANAKQIVADAEKAASDASANINKASGTLTRLVAIGNSAASDLASTVKELAYKAQDAAYSVKSIAGQAMSIANQASSMVNSVADSVLNTLNTASASINSISNQAIGSANSVLSTINQIGTVPGTIPIGNVSLINSVVNQTLSIAGQTMNTVNNATNQLQSLTSGISQAIGMTSIAISDSVNEVSSSASMITSIANETYNTALQAVDDLRLIGEDVLADAYQEIADVSLNISDNSNLAFTVSSGSITTSTNSSYITELVSNDGMSFMSSISDSTIEAISSVNSVSTSTSYTSDALNLTVSEASTNIEIPTASTGNAFIDPAGSVIQHDDIVVTKSGKMSASEYQATLKTDISSGGNSTTKTLNEDGTTTTTVKDYKGNIISTKTS